MGWFEPVDAYCERTGPEYWAEPVNALTNAAFVLAAAILWPRGRGVPIARALVGVLAVIGAGSFLWHTHATRRAGLDDRGLPAPCSRGALTRPGIGARACM